MNPFSYGTIVKEPYFFDRKEELKKIVEVLSGGNNLVMYAPRRFGKTSLVFKAMEELQKKGFTCAYFDFMAIYSRETFIEAYSKEILSKQPNIKKALDLFSKFIRNIKPSVSIDDNGKPEFSIQFSESSITDKTMDSVIDMPEKFADKEHPYIIIMDEFQDISKLNGEKFEALLRSNIQHHQNVNYLFLGSRTHILKDMFGNRNRPFYNSAYTMNLEALPVNDTVNYLKERFEQHHIKLNNEVAKLIIEEAGYIPYYIQLLASEIWQNTIKTKNEVHVDDIQWSTKSILEHKSDYYFELFDSFSAYQKKLLKALAHENTGIFSKDYAEKYRLSSTSTTQKAITVLLKEGVIEKHADTYSFTDPFFKRFLLYLKA